MSFLEKYLDAFPFFHPWIAQDNQTVFYLKEELTGERHLYSLNLSESQNLEEGTIVSRENFSKRSYSPIRLFKDMGKLLIMSDDENKENFNFYWLDLSSGDLDQLTETTYCGVYGIRPDEKVLIYGDRYKKSEGKYSTKLYFLDLESGEQHLLLDDDEWSYRLGWSGVTFNESFSKIYLRVDKDNARRFNNILELDLETKENRHLLPRELECAGIWTLNEVITGNDLYFVSDLDGNDNIYHRHLGSGVITQMTNYQVDNNGIRIFPKSQKVVTTLSYPERDETEIHVFDLQGNQIKNEFSSKMAGSLFLSSTRDTLWLNRSLMDDPSTLMEFIVDTGILEPARQIRLYKGEKEDLSHNEYRFASYSTFDDHLVPAFLSLPKGELKGALITSFYGGQNYYDHFDQILSEMGIAHLSPAVRGSWTNGKEWRDKIKGDLGGDEILDVLWAAKFLEEELGLPPEKIGVMGGSHGGYATLRCLTMPENFKGRESTSYPFGFGLCWAGFADLEDFYHTSNIPDWLVDMLAPYEGNEELYRDRSPVHHFDNLKAPLFVCHGTNDARVSATSMEGFLDKLKDSDKDFVLHMVEGGGHSNAGRENKLREYKVVTEFLNRVLD